jgi:hypothetical protein
MHRRLIRVRHGARRPAREQPNPHTPTPWTSQTSDQVAALLSRIDSLLGLPETS